MNLKVPIEILDELAETVIRSTGCLDLASGEIFDVRYEIDRPGLMGIRVHQRRAVQRRQGRGIPHRR